MSTAPAFAFDGKNPAAQRAAARYAARLVTGVTRETKAAIRSVVLRSINEGIPVYDAARLIRGLVGLNTRQAGAAATYWSELLNAGHTLADANALFDRYVEGKVADRADTIARTEILGALNEGARESWRQAQDDGLLSRDAVKEWIVTPDEKLCPSCEPMDGVQVPLRALFRTPLGDVVGPPLHPNCRCAHAATEPDR